jgi:hypothetical protein
MKKARLLLAVLVSVAVIGGVFSFKASRFTSIPAWKYTTMIRSFNNMPYYTTSFFCTSLAEGAYYISNGGTLYTTTFYSSGAPTGVITLSSPGGGIITIGNQPCSVLTTYLTTAF